MIGRPLPEEASSVARILIAEDDPDVRSLISLLLVEAGHEVGAVGNGALAVERLAEDPPDVLILDIMMPELDGYGVLQELHRSGVGAAVKVLMLSARTSEADFERSFELGACDYLSKPFDPDELIERTERLLALTKGDIQRRREDERDKAHLLSQLESIFSAD